MNLTSRQKQVLDYLKGRDWTSPTEIGQAVWRPPHHSAAASPVCKRLVELGYLERNSRGHYRFANYNFAPRSAPNHLSPKQLNGEDLFRALLYVVNQAQCHPGDSVRDIVNEAAELYQLPFEALWTGSDDPPIRFQPSLPR